MNFPTDPASIVDLLDRVDPVQYGKTRNFINGAVTRLSPYISRGVLTLPQVRDAVLAKGYQPRQIEKFLQELAWREFFQRVWWAQGDSLFQDLKQPQAGVLHHQVPVALLNASTGIDAIDQQLHHLYETGYLHNHARMYIAGITCNLAGAHWHQPSRWMYYHLLDGDFASNTCSWQWVAGSFSSKKYIANQENINRYLYSTQTNTYLDQPYDTILKQPVPEALRETTELNVTTILPNCDKQVVLNPQLPVALYTSYWINPAWRKDEPLNRVLLLEPSHFQKYPISQKVLAFIIQLAKETIPGIQIVTGEFSELQQLLDKEQQVYYLQHPLHRHFRGVADPYPWMFPQIQGSFSSFFSFWKKAEKHL
jgi:deoxyribodipyrimidine photo-lyase